MKKLKPDFSAKILSIKEENKFFEAVRIGDDEVVRKALGKYGASIMEKQDYSGRTALTLAAFFGKKSTAALLLKEGASVDGRCLNNETPLLYAAYAGHRNVIALLLKNGAVVDGQNDNGRTPLMEAAWEGYKDIVELLLENGADIYKRDKDGWTASTYAVDGEYFKVARFIDKWRELQRQRKEQQFARELDEITKTMMGGLRRPLPYKPPFKFLPPGGTL